MARGSKILEKGAEVLGDMSVGTAAAIGIGGLGAVALIGGGIANGTHDYRKGKAMRAMRKANTADDTADALTVAGAIATTGCATYGIMTAISKLK
jgi:hypothetical protein